MRDFRELKVWEKAHQLTLHIYETTRKFPRHEIFGITGQTRRASVSIPANIAEGCGRGSSADLARFLQISMGSASELEYLLMLSNALNFLNEQGYIKLNSQVTEIKRMLTSFIKRLRTES
jgi:four helix bundle protein